MHKTNNLSAQITRYGVSESFIALVDGIRETPGLTADHKHRQADVNKVAQYLVCRNYGKACLELSYLCWAVVNYSKEAKSSSLIDFFWLNESISPKLFRQAFEQPWHTKQSEQASIELTQDVLQLNIANSTFAISPTRVGALAVLLEFIVNISPQGFNLLEEVTTDLEQASDANIKALSSSLQKIIYQYLSEHLIPAQQQRRLRYITQWLDEHNIQLPFLNDDTLLNFWQQASVDDASPGFKLYSTVFHEFIEAEQALKQAQASLQGQHASTIGFDVENGEFSPDAIQSILFAQCSEIENYNWLCQSPKFLTKAQWAIIAPLHHYRPYLKTLSLSFARLFIFSQWQSILVQAKRKSPQITRQKLNEQPTQNYTDFYQQVNEQINNISAVMLALSHVFYSHQDPRFLSYLTDKLSPSTASELKLNTEHILAQALNEQGELANIFNNIIAISIKHPEINSALALAKKAFKANNKDGFKQLPCATLLDNYQQGAEALQHCKQALSMFIKKIPTNEQCSTLWTEKFASDVSIFKQVFEQIYGGVHV
ncbi:MAG: hypothetical protein OCD00_07415 [Colwellia sp.]